MNLFSKSLKSQSDESLMLLLLKKEQKAFDVLYQRYSKKILNYFYRNLNFDNEKSQDFLHDLFIKIIEKPELFDTTKTFKSWIYTIAGNMIKNEYKRQEVRNIHFENEKDNSEVFVHSFDTDLDNIVFEKELNLALMKMDTESRMLFSLRYHEELSVSEIAQILNIPEGTVKSRLFYLIKKLSNKLISYKPN